MHTTENLTRNVPKSFRRKDDPKEVVLPEDVASAILTLSDNLKKGSTGDSGLFSYLDRSKKWYELVKIISFILMGAIGVGISWQKFESSNATKSFVSGSIGPAEDRISAVENDVATIKQDISSVRSSVDTLVSQEKVRLQMSKEASDCGYEREEYRTQLNEFSAGIRRLRPEKSPELKTCEKAERNQRNQ